MKPCDLSSQPTLFHYAILLARYIHYEKEIESLLSYVKVKKSVDRKRPASHPLCPITLRKKKVVLLLMF